MLAAVIILILAFGSVLAMGLPIGTALFGLGIGSALVSLGSNVISMPDFTTAMVAMIGIGVGIDYALFIVTRYREGLQLGLDVEESVVEAMDTSGRAVLFAGATVIISLLGLCLMGLDFVQGVAIASSLGVLMMVLGSLTLLPALLGWVGRRIDNTTRAALIAVSVVVVATFVGVATGQAPIFFAGLFGVDHLLRPQLRDQAVAQARPAPRRATQAGAVLVPLEPVHPAPAVAERARCGGPSSCCSRSRCSGSGSDSVTTATIPRARPCAGRTTCWPKGSGPAPTARSSSPSRATRPPITQQLQAFAQTIQETENVNFVVPTPINDELALLIVYPDSAPQDAETGTLVATLRDDVIPATGVEANVGGLTAASTDFSNYLAGRMPLLIGVVLLLSFLLLMAVFRSVLVPLKAVVMNLLSIGAAYGILVAIFQWGWGMELIGVDRAGPIEAWVPMFLFAIVFGLSMDYEVFLLSRIKEEYDRTKDNATAVADGLAVTARVITAAALIMFCVFAAFALGDDRQLKLFGLGLAIAVLLDATIVRMLLVPATMELLGDRNWWIPKWLDRILPNIDVEGHAHHEPVAVGRDRHRRMVWSPPRTATVSATTSPSSSRSTELSAPDAAIRRSGADRTGGVTVRSGRSGSTSGWPYPTRRGPLHRRRGRRLVDRGRDRTASAGRRRTRSPRWPRVRPGHR